MSVTTILSTVRYLERWIRGKDTSGLTDLLREILLVIENRLGPCHQCLNVSWGREMRRFLTGLHQLVFRHCKSDHVAGTY